MNQEPTYTVPASLMQAVITTLMALPGNQAFNILYNVKGMCDQQDQKRAQDAHQTAVDDAVTQAVNAALAGQHS